MVGGADGDDGVHASAVVLAADGSGWSVPAQMSTRRASSAVGLLPTGRVIVAGGQNDVKSDSVLSAVEQWDPIEDKCMDSPSTDGGCPGRRFGMCAGGRTVCGGGRVCR